MTDHLATHRQSGIVIDPSATASLTKVSWGAIFAGVVIALAAQFLLNLLGVGIGAAVLDPATYDNPDASTFSIAGGLWYVVAGLIAAFLGGFVASRLSGRPLMSVGALHGLATWAVTTLVVLYLLTTSVGALVGGAISGLGSVIGGATQSAASAVPAIAENADPLAGIESRIREATGGNDPAALRDTAVTAVRALLTGDEATAEDARARAAEAVARAQNIPVDQARTQVEQYETDYRETVAEVQRQATEAAQTATVVISSGAILAFVALVLGALAGWFGGRMGTREAFAVVEDTHRRAI